MESTASDQSRPQKYINLNALSQATLTDQHDQNSPHFASSPQIGSHIRGGFQRESTDLYFLRDSADGMRRNNNLTPDGSQPMSWQEEKDMLLSLLTKNQDLATSMQQKLEEEISEHERKYETDMQDLRKEISTLKQENKILKDIPLNQSQLNMSATSLNSDTKTKNFIESLRGQLLGEIERLERAYAEREADLQSQNQRLCLQLDARDTEVQRMQEQLHIHEEVAKKSIADLGLEKGSEINMLQTKIKEMEYENKSLEHQISSRDQQLWHWQRKEEEEGQRSKKKETVASEREKLVKAISRNVELIREKEDIYKDKISHLEREVRISKQEMKDKLNTLFHEKNKSEEALSADLALKSEELGKVKGLLQKLKQSSAELIETSKQKERSKEAEINALRAQNAELRSRCLELEKQYEGERSTLRSSLQEYQKMLAQAEERLQKGWDQGQFMVQNLEKEVSQLLQQSQNKDKELQKLRKKVLELETQDRTRITQMIAFSEKSLNELEARQGTLLQDYARLQRELLDSDESHTKLELADGQKLNELLEELAEVKFQLQQVHASKVNEENQELKQSMVFMQAELDHAKKNLVAYMQTVSQLEDKIEIRYQKGDTASLRKEVEKLKLEIMRLNEENQGLANAKTKIESMYADRIDELQNSLFEKSTAFSALHSKYIKLQQTGCYLREEELLAWKKRQETVKNLLKRLNHQVEDFRFQRNTIQKLKKHDSQMLMQQLEEYKKSSGKVEEFWKQQHASWASQNETLRGQLEAMSTRVDSSSKYYKEMGGLLEREKENYKLINQQLERRARIPVSTGASSFSRSEESFRAEKYQLVATVNNLQRQVEVLSEQFNTAREEAEKQAHAKEKAYVDKLAISKAKEVSALSQLASLEQQAEEQSRLFVEFEKNKTQELEILEFEIEILKRVSNLPPSQGRLSLQNHSQDFQKKLHENMKKLEALIAGDLKRESQKNQDQKSYDKIVKRLGFIEEAARKTNCKILQFLEKAVQESKIVASQVQRMKLEQLENQSRLAVIQIQLNAVFVKVAKDLENFMALHTSEKERLSITLEKTVGRFKEEEARLKEQIQLLETQKNKLLRQLASGLYSPAQQTEEVLDPVSVDSLILLLEGIKQQESQRHKVPSLSLSLKRSAKSEKKSKSSKTLYKGSGGNSGRISKMGSPNTRFFSSQPDGITEELLMKEREWK